MAAREILQLGHPRLRERARDVRPDELRSDEVQRFIDDLVETMRTAGGAGLAATQVDVPLRIFAVEVGDNARYPYKPRIALRILVNPVITSASDETYASYEGCLSVPNLRGVLPRAAEIEISYLDRDGERVVERVRGLSAGTFQHEVDHLDGIVFVDRVEDPRTLCTWDEFHLRHEAAFVESVRPLIERDAIERL
jgi:peptide deformylase